MKAFKYAINGIRAAFGSELHIRLHSLVALLVVIAGWFFEISRMEWISILICIAMVITVELLNTAIEYLVNMISPDHNILAGKIKDIAAGAVLIAAIGALFTGLIIFAPKVLELFRNP